MLNFLKNRPLLCAALISSVISVFCLRSEVTLFIFAIIILIVIFIMVYKKVKSELVFAMLLVLAVTVSGFLTTSKIHKLEEYDDFLCCGEFTVASKPINHGEIYSVILETDKSNILNKGDKITVNYSETTLKFSERIKAEIKLSKYGDNQSENSFYAESEFIQGNIISAEKTGSGDTVLEAVRAVRRYIKNTIFENYETEEASTVMALVAGDKSYFSPEFDCNVKRAGVAHVMVVSGMHLSIIVMMLLYICNRFFYNRFLKAIIILFATVAVMAVCGFTMSIMRAGITYLLVALSLLLGRENTGENTLGFAVTLILISNPYAIFSVAFELSVLSTFAILVVAIPIIDSLSERINSKTVMTLLASVIISVSALLFTAPVSVYYFGYLSTVSIAANLLIGTATSFIMIFCILGFIFPFLFFDISELLTTYINSVINYFGALSFSVVEVPRSSIIYIVILIIVVLLILVACKVRQDMVKLKEARIRRTIEGGNGKYAADFGTEIKRRSKKTK